MEMLFYISHNSKQVLKRICFKTQQWNYNLKFQNINNNDESKLLKISDWF